MSPIDPEVAQAVRAALGLKPGDPGPPDLLAASAAVEAAANATRLDEAALLTLTAGLVRQVRADPGGPGLRAARQAIAEGGWPLTRYCDLTDMLAVLLALAAAWGGDDQLDQLAADAAEMP